MINAAIVRLFYFRILSRCYCNVYRNNNPILVETIVKIETSHLRRRSYARGVGDP